MSNGKIAYQRRKLCIEQDDQLIDVYNFYRALVKRDGDSCQACGIGKRSLLKEDEYLIPTVIGADMFHKNAYRNTKMNLDTTKLFCRPCHNAYNL